MAPVTRSRNGIVKPSERARLNEVQGVSTTANALACRNRATATRKKRAPGLLKKFSEPLPKKAIRQPKKNAATKKRTTKQTGKKKTTTRKPATTTANKARTSPTARQSRGFRNISRTGHARSKPVSEPLGTPPAPVSSSRRHRRRASSPAWRPIPGSPDLSSAPSTPRLTDTRPRRRRSALYQRPLRQGLRGGTILTSGGSRISKPRKGSGRKRTNPKTMAQSSGGGPSRFLAKTRGARNVRFSAPPGSPGDADDDFDGDESKNPGKDPLGSHAPRNPPHRATLSKRNRPLATSSKSSDTPLTIGYHSHRARGFTPRSQRSHTPTPEPELPERNEEIQRTLTKSGAIVGFPGTRSGGNISEQTLGSPHFPSGESVDSRIRSWRSNSSRSTLRPEDCCDFDNGTIMTPPELRRRAASERSDNILYREATPGLIRQSPSPQASIGDRPTSQQSTPQSAISVHTQPSHHRTVSSGSMSMASSHSRSRGSVLKQSSSQQMQGELHESIERDDDDNDDRAEETQSASGRGLLSRIFRR